MARTKVLVAVASRHGSTREIGRAVGDVLEDRGFAVDLREPDDVDGVDAYDAVVLGCSVYVGRWAASARALVDRLAPGLTGKPVWLFSSGPGGVPAVPPEDPEEVPSLMTRTGARGHRTFAGALDTDGLSLAERAVVALLRMQTGDSRSWPEIEGRAATIAEGSSTGRRSVTFSWSGDVTAP